VVLVLVGLVPIAVALLSIRLLSDVPSEFRPDPSIGLVLTLVGGAVIAGSGLYTLYRERLVSKKRMAAESVVSPTMAPSARHYRRLRR
jgi:hypothetical protein